MGENTISSLMINFLGHMVYLKLGGLDHLLKIVVGNLRAGVDPTITPDLICNLRLIIPHTNQEGMKSSITHTLRPSGESHASPCCC